jgi:hypothetical protein
MNRLPTSPGEMLLEEFLRPRGVTQVELAMRMGVPVQRVNTIVNGLRAPGGPRRAQADIVRRERCAWRWLHDRQRDRP